MRSLLQTAGLFALTAAAACAGPEGAAPREPAPAESAAVEPTPTALASADVAAADLPPVDLSSWGTERIPLPPDFAPTLPSGDEVLLFAPGMFDADSPEYWSYAFLIELGEPLEGAAALDAFLEAYYDGLIAAVASGKSGDVGADPATVEVSAVDGGYGAVVDLIDAFVTMEPVRLRMTIAVEGERGERLRIAASPQDAGHDIWRALDAAAASLEL